MGDRGDEAQFVDDQQVQPEKLPLQVEQTPLVPGLQRSTLTPPFTYLVFTDATPQPVYFAAMALLDRRTCRMVAESGRGGWKQPCLRPRLEIPAICGSGGGWKPRFIPTRQDGILLLFQPGVPRDDALRLRQGLGERAGGQESGVKDVLGPGKVLELSREWEQVDNRGNPVPAGDYLVRGVFRLEWPGQLVTSPHRLEVLAATGQK